MSTPLYEVKKSVYGGRNRMVIAGMIVKDDDSQELIALCEREVAAGTGTVEPVKKVQPKAKPVVVESDMEMEFKSTRGRRKADAE